MADLERLIEELRRAAEAEGLGLEAEVSLLDRRIGVELELVGLELWIAELVRNL